MTKCSGVGTAVCNRSGPHKLASVFEGIRVGKNHCLVFLGGLDPGQAPFKTQLLMLGLT